MENIQNGDIKRKLSEDIHATNPSKMPPAITDYIVPTLLVNDLVYYSQMPLIETGTATNATSTTIFTTNSSYETYITSFTLGLIKDVTATSTASALTAVIGGVTKTLISIPGITLTIQNSIISASLPTPLRIDRSSIVAVTNTTATGNVTATASVRGFLRVLN